MASLSVPKLIAAEAALKQLSALPTVDAKRLAKSLGDLRRAGSAEAEDLADARSKVTRIESAIRDTSDEVVLGVMGPNAQGAAQWRLVLAEHVETIRASLIAA